jgi:hypothetical protein
MNAECLPWIGRNLRANPIGNLQVLIGLREFNFGQYNTLQNIVIDIDLPSNVFMDDEVPNLVQNMPVAHRSQDFFGVDAGYRIFKFCSNQTPPTTFQGNGCFVVCDANSGFMAVVVRYQSVSNFRVPDDVFFPSIMRDKKLTFDFQWHGGKRPVERPVPNNMQAQYHARTVMIYLARS